MSQCCQSFTGLITGPIVHESSSQNEEMQIKIKPILLSGFVAFAIDWLFDAQQERTAEIAGDRGPRVGGWGG